MDGGKLALLAAIIAGAGTVVVGPGHIHDALGAVCFLCLIRWTSPRFD